MADKTIDEVPVDDSVTGVEKIPVSDGGTAKSVTVGSVRDFIFTAIKSISDKSGVAGSGTDKVYLKKHNSTSGEWEFVQYSVADLTNIVYGIVFGATGISQASITGTEEFVLDTSNGSRTLTVGTLKAWMEANLSNFEPNIQGHDEAETANGVDLLLLAKYVDDTGEGSAGWENQKLSVSTLCSYVVANLFSGATETTSVGADDYVYVLHNTGTSESPQYVTRKAKYSSLGIGSGDVVGPNSSTSNDIVRFNGTTGKSVKGGLSVVESSTDEHLVSHSNITATCSNAQVPSAHATYLYGNEITANMVTHASSAAPSEGNIPQWNGGTPGHGLKNGLSVVTEMPASPTDTQLPTAQCVSEAIASGISSQTGLVKTDVTASASNAGKIPNWDATNKLQIGYPLAAAVTAQTRNTQTVASVQCAANYADTAAGSRFPASPTAGNIPMLTAQGGLSDGLGLLRGSDALTWTVSTITDTYLATVASINRYLISIFSTAIDFLSPSDQKIATEKAVRDAVVSRRNGFTLDETKVPLKTVWDHVPTAQESTSYSDGDVIFVTEQYPEFSSEWKEPRMYLRWSGTWKKGPFFVTNSDSVTDVYDKAFES